MSFNNFVNSLRNFEFKTIEVEINREFCGSKCGILRISQVVLGFVCFITILVSCYNYYDPYYETYSGFVGGKSETAFMLIVFACLALSTTLLICYTFSSDMSAVIPKTVFELSVNSLSFGLYLITSLTLLIEISARNSNRAMAKDIYEPGFAGKIIASVFGLVTTGVYAVSIYFYYKLYKTLSTVV